MVKARATSEEKRQAVLILVGKGYSNVKLARVLGMSHRTIERIKAQAKGQADVVKAEAGELAKALEESTNA